MMRRFDHEGLGRRVTRQAAGLRRITGACLGMLVLAFPAHAEAIATGTTRMDYGFFCATEPASQRAAPDTISGVVNHVPETPRLIRLGPKVPARIGIGFGVIAQVQPQFAGPVRAITLHPPLGPNGVTRESFDANLSATEQTYLGFSFEYPYELALGTWTLSAEANGRVIYKVDFNVVDPKTMPDVKCGEEVPLS